MTSLDAAHSVDPAHGHRRRRSPFPSCCAGHGQASALLAPITRAVLDEQRLLGQRKRAMYGHTYEKWNIAQLEKPSKGKPVFCSNVAFRPWGSWARLPALSQLGESNDLKEIVSPRANT